jgi:hypothetical protein
MRLPTLTGGGRCWVGQMDMARFVGFREWDFLSKDIGLRHNGEMAHRSNISIIFPLTHMLDAGIGCYRNKCFFVMGRRIGW